MTSAAEHREGPGAARMQKVTGCWRMERSADGRYRPKIFLVADQTVVIAEAALDFPSLDAGRVLAATIANMLDRQAPEILRP
jgi:hypothetical protein